MRLEEKGEMEPASSDKGDNFPPFANTEIAECAIVLRRRRRRRRR